MTTVDPLERCVRPVWRAVCWSCGVNSEPSDEHVDHVLGWLMEEIPGCSMSLDQIIVAGTRFTCPVCALEAEPATFTHAAASD